MFQLLQIMAETGPARMGETARARFQAVKHVFTEVGQERGVAPALLAAIAKRESDRFDPRSEHPETGARGLMQVIPSTARDLGVPYDQLHRPRVAIRAGADDLLRKGYGEDPLDQVLAAYGGFVPPIEHPGGRDDPGPYIRYILTAYWSMWWNHGLDLRPVEIGS